MNSHKIDSHSHETLIVDTIDMIVHKRIVLRNHIEEKIKLESYISSLSLSLSPSLAIQCNQDSKCEKQNLNNLR